MNAAIHSSTLRDLVSTAIFGCALALISSVSAAGSNNRPVSLTVSFSDLDISSPAGAVELYHRIDRAAVAACSYYWFTSDKDEARCIHDAIANAVIDVNEPALIDVYKSKNAQPLPALRLLSRGH